jgi:membrane AbrB-like protein
MKTHADAAARVLVVAAIALLGAWTAVALRAPLPWMLGPLIVSALVALSRFRVRGAVPVMPPRLRDIFVPVIGLMIGSRVSPETIEHVRLWWPSLLLVPPFALATQMLSYGILRKFASFDRATAFFASSPGGIAEASIISERLGGDPASTVVQHLARVSLTVTLIPLMLNVFMGQTVGSASGASLAAIGDPLTLPDILLLGIGACAGVLAARRLRLPAANLLGPLIVSAAMHGSGVTSATIPDWIVHITQLVIGASLGGRFAAVEMALLWRGALFSLPLLAVSLSVAALAGLLVQTLGFSTGIVGFISFAPGGVTEMNLIAVSINADSIFVACHHLVRIITATLLFPLIFRWTLAKH